MGTGVFMGFAVLGSFAVGVGALVSGCGILLHFYDIYDFDG